MYHSSPIKVGAAIAMCAVGLTACSSNHHALPESESFTASAGGGFSDAASDVTTDDRLNVITIGDFQDLVDFTPGDGIPGVLSNGGSDTFVLKHSAAGELLWAATLGGIENDLPRAVDTDRNENVVVSGQFRDTVDFDPGAGEVFVTSDATISAFVLKLDPDGVFQWVVPFGSTGTNHASDVVTDPSGNVFATGMFAGTVDFDPSPNVVELTANGSRDTFIIKLTPGGALDWVRQIGGMGESIGLDPSGNVFVAGSFNNTVDLDPGTQVDEYTSVGSEDAYLVSLDSDGAQRWSRVIGSPDTDRAFELVADSDGFVTVAGQFDGPVDVDPGAGDFILTPIGFQGVFVVQFAPDGSFNWADTVDSVEFTEVTSMTIDVVNNVYVGGAYFFEEAIVGTGVQAIALPIEGMADGFLVRFNQDGTLESADRFGDSGFEVITGIDIDEVGSLTFAGHFDRTVTLDPPFSGTLSSNGYQDFYTLHYAPEDSAF